MNTQIQKTIDEIALQTAMLDSEDIPAMGQLMNLLKTFGNDTENLKDSSFSNTLKKARVYLEKLIMGEANEVTALENEVKALQDRLQKIEKNETREIDKVTEQTALRTSEDLEILNDFITESRENLETIEQKLIALEHNPDDRNIINGIFRPFHTVKGVSAFLELNKINRLCHHTENLIDGAREGSLIIDNDIADIILEAVDTLNLMIDVVENSLVNKTATCFDNIDIEPLIEKIKTVAAGTGDNKKKPIGSILIETGAIEKSDLRDALKTQKHHPEKKLGEILVDENKVEPNAILSALKIQKNGKRSANLQIKVDTDKLDNLVDLTGELVIAQSMFKQIGLDVAANNQKYFQQLNQVTQAVSSIQKIAMSMRMVPIKNTFQKMLRLVRDLARTQGKEVDLRMTGEETEIDRNMVDELYEPLVHMIRNAVDHGLEIPADRENAGKNRKGTIQLCAYQKGGNIVIEIEDDGKGLDKNIILEKAIARDLTDKDAILSDKEIYNFILHPGFSTAEKVTNISGRGVGMDVVKKGIEKLRGRIDIDTELGKGTRFIVTLPLTLAIVEGMLVRVGMERYIIPTYSILESLRPNQKDYHTVKGKGEMIMARESLIPLVRIDRLFNVSSESDNPMEGIVVVVESEGDRKALLFDELLGKEEFVIKSIGDTFKNVRGIAGGAILGDGKVGLILDMCGLFADAIEN